MLGKTLARLIQLVPHLWTDVLNMRDPIGTSRRERAEAIINVGTIGDGMAPDSRKIGVEQRQGMEW